MSRIGKTKSSATRRTPPRARAVDPKPPKAPAVTAPPSGFDTHRTYSKLTGVTSTSLRADDATSEGRNRGTPDDSIGRNRGTPDDSIGGGRSSRNPTGGVYGFVDASSLGQSGSGFDTRIGPASPGRAPSAGRQTSQGGGQTTTVFGASSFGTAPTSNRAQEQLTSPAQKSRSDAEKAITRSATFKALPRADQAAIKRILKEGGANATKGMAELFGSGKAGLLNAKDADGTSVLQHLSRLANSKRAAVAGDLLSDLADPKDIEQGYAPTCTSTSMQYELAKERPAEYVRLLTGLTVDGRATMAGGGVLTVNAKDAIKQSDRNNDFRTDSEAIFQTAAMEFANGADRFNTNRQRSEGNGKAYRGLFPEQVRGLVGQLLGDPYQVREVQTDAEARTELAKLAAREGPNRPVFFDLSMGRYNHCVSLEAVTATQVTFRDPASGQVLSMSHAAFVSQLTAVYHAASTAG